MSGTIRRDTTLLGLLPDNTTQQIGADDLRDLCVSKLNIFPQTVSAAGTDQSGATTLTDMFNIVTSATADQGVKATASFTEVWNATSVTIKVYPVSGAQFEAFGTNAPISLAPGASVRINMTSGTQGYVR